MSQDSLSELKNYIEQLEKRVALLEKSLGNQKKFSIPDKEDVVKELFAKHGETYEVAMAIANEWVEYWNDENWTRKGGVKVKSWKRLLSSTYSITKSQILHKIEVKQRENKLLNGEFRKF